MPELPKPRIIKGTQPSNLFISNKPAYVDSLLRTPANLRKDPVARLYEKNAPSTQVAGEEYRSTHLMSDNGQGYVYPQLVREPMRQGLTDLKTNEAAEAYARRTNTGIQLSPERGSWLAANGYKLGANVNNDIDSETGRPSNWAGFQLEAPDPQPGRPVATAGNIFPARLIKGGLPARN